MIIKRIINKIKTIYKKRAIEAEYQRENKKDLALKTNYHPELNQAIDAFKKNGGIFNYFALAESAVRSFFYQLYLLEKDEYSLIELGGGQSTLFLNSICEASHINLYSYEHDPDYVKYLKTKVTSNKVIVNYTPLKQISADVRAEIFANPKEAIDIFIKKAQDVSPDEFKNTRLVNGFYTVLKEQFPNKEIDGIIVDGPHGNGRSLAFSIFYKYMKPGLLVLMDDFDHYPFLDDLSKLCKYTILEKRKYKTSIKAWVVLRIEKVL
ncbi:MAG: hypothetical protein A2Y40_05270 [Candidatus Margulisbacteria bacterium GWF2_35_9]|nr:MAG: hypothetical protein A2Y40_05270 [Candidatus Margulisbacteria bacterium GWF2_35_9]